MNIGEIASAMKQNSEQHKPVLIAIEGFAGSGKSPVADKLKTVLGNAYVIRTDDFIIKQRLTDKSPDQTGFDRVRLEQQVLLPATTGQPITYQILQWAEHTLSE